MYFHRNKRLYTTRVTQHRVKSAAKSALFYERKYLSRSINLITSIALRSGTVNLFAYINPFLFLYGREIEYLISRRIYFIPAIYITPSSDLNNNPIRSAVDGRRASQVYVSPPCLLVGTKQICEIAFPRARGMRNRECTRRNRNGIRTRQFVQRAIVMTSNK